ncbi:hypothetical protein [Lysobacter sp. CA196]|uniref:hypothetical protein n=1 Tax=Lysobacter sp. CA196 TaxID=3455606 RepID=UPI003F8D421F
MAIDLPLSNSLHLTDDQREALRAADPDAFADDGDDAILDGEATASTSPDSSESDESVPAAARSAVPMIPKPRLDEVLNRVSELERQLRERDARDTAVPAGVQDRDFGAERGQIRALWEAETAVLKKKWDEGDLDADEYHDQRDALTIKYGELGHALTVEEARHVVQSDRIASRQQAAQASWNDKIGAWATAHSTFMANPIRKKAVADLLAVLDTDGDGSLNDDELIAKMQEQAFEAFGWLAPTPEQPQAIPDPQAALRARQAAAARAAASASAAPPQVAGGAGTGSRDLTVDLSQIKPGDFKKIPESTQRALLGEDIL